jgi:hypothetical protein
MRVIATKVKETKGFIRYESKENGSIITAYVPKAQIVGEAPETVAITIEVSGRA